MEKELFRRFFEELPKAARRMAQSKNIPEDDALKELVNRAKKAYEKQPTQIDREKAKAAEFTAEAKVRGQPVVDSMKKWVRENKYQLPPGVDAPTHLENLKKVITTVDYTTPELSWLVPVNPQDALSVAEAEYLARVGLAHKDLLNNPECLLREAARLSASVDDASMTQEARARVSRLLNKTILRIRALRDSQGMTIPLDNEELTYAIRGFVLYDEELDGPDVPGDQNGALKNVLVQQAKEHAAKGKLSPEEEKRNLSYMRNQITKGNAMEFNTPQAGAAQRAKRVFWEPALATPYAERITRHVNALELRINAARTLSDLEPESAAQLLGLTVANIRYLSSAEVEKISKAYRTLSRQEQEKFEDEMIRTIHKLFSDKMATTEEWRRTSIETPVSELDSWLRLLKDLNPENSKLFEDMNTEEEAIRWLHGLFLALRRGPSPTDTKAVLANAQEYDDNKLHKAISNFPGVEKAFQLFEKHQDDVIGSEIDKGLWEKTLKNMVEEIKADKDLYNTLVKKGISPQDSINIAHRFWLEVGLDAKAYSAYLYRHNLLHYEVNPDTGLVEGHLDPRAPKMWNALRLAEAPEALWAFFNIGGIMKGTEKTVTAYVPGPNNSYQEVTFKTSMGAGVGADVIRTLLENKFDLGLPDFFSRRHPYIIDGWMEKITRDAYIDSVADPGRKAELLEAKRIKGFNLPGLQQADRLQWKLRKLQAEFIKARENVYFAIDNGIPTRDEDVPPQADMLGKIGALQREFTGRQDLLDELDAVRDRYPDIAQRAAAHNTRIYDDPRFKNIFGEPLDYKSRGFYPTMENYKLSQINWDEIQRSAEFYRGHVRDIISGLSVSQSVLDFINNPSVANFQKLDISSMTSYTSPDVAQMKLIIPAYLALWDVQRGKGPLGYDVGFGFVKAFKSKYARIYKTISLTDLDLYKIGLEVITRRGMSEEALTQLRGGFNGLVRDKALFYADPASLLVLFGAMAQETGKQISKDLEK